MGWILVDLDFIFQAGYVHPWATGYAVVLQMIALVHLGLRTS